MKFVQAKGGIGNELKIKKKTLSGSYGGDSNKVCVVKGKDKFKLRV